MAETRFSLKYLIVLLIVSWGVVVANLNFFIILKCSSAIASTNFVPPASIDP